MNKWLMLGLLVGFMPGLGAAGSDEPPFRPPAVPLVTSDPYLSIWSEADRLTDGPTRHWTHHPHPLVGLLRVDGKPYRLMGDQPKGVPAFPQRSVRVWPTRSIYEFGDGHVHVTVTFMTPALPDDLDVLARPLSYITWQVKSADGAAHAVSIYDSTSALLAVNVPTQRVEWARETMGSLTAMHAGTVDQSLLVPAGDDTRIDWGNVYAAAPSGQATAAIGGDNALVHAFLEDGKLPGQDDSRMPRAAEDDQPVMAFVFDLGDVGAQTVARHLMIAYDEIYSIKFFGTKLRPYWRRDGATPADLLQSAERDYPQLTTRCEAFDKELMADLTKAGGERYAQICALAYRQCLAANGLAADSNKQPLLFTKENTSNGDIATVDVIFPQDPIFLLLSPTLAKASLAAVLNYGASDHWKFPCAPHDLGTYPNARGTDDGGEAMPVEESGNVLILMDAIAKAEGNTDFSTPWWPKLTEWAKFLEQFGLDPEDQLCTDDFMGHLAHNANLSIKAVLGLAAYGDLCRMRGDNANARRYADLAKADAAHWIKAADDGDHYRLAFDKPGTWSQKYNLVWDKVLGLDVFPPEVAQKEIAFYKTKLQRFGVPLDSRTRLGDTDHSFFAATLAGNPADFDAMTWPFYDYLNTTTDRNPMSDTYQTVDIHSGGMHARPVVGGVFIKMLTVPDLWHKWASADRAKVGPWAPLPARPQITEVVSTSQKDPQIWRYTTEKPSEDWTESGFDASGWQQGPGVFGNGTPHQVPARTKWNTPDIWLRRELTVPSGEHPNLQFLVYHDEDVEIYVDGVPAATEGSFNSGYEPSEIRPAAKALLKPGAKIVLAVHCHQTVGGQGIDVGMADVVQGRP